MELLWLAAPMIVCAAMMYMMMKMMSGMGRSSRNDAEPEKQQPDRTALNAQIVELERRLKAETASRERSS